MSEFTLKTVAVLDVGAFGVLLHNGLPFAVTLTRTYESPDGQLVKVRPGLWKCTRRRYNRGGYDTWEIHIPGHNYLLFHKLNWEEESDGCLGVGESFAVINNKPGIAQSGEGFKEFMMRSQHLDEFNLSVINS